MVNERVKLITNASLYKLTKNTNVEREITTRIRNGVNLQKIRTKMTIVQPVELRTSQIISETIGIGYFNKIKARLK